MHIDFFLAISPCDLFVCEITNLKNTQFLSIHQTQFSYVCIKLATLVLRQLQLQTMQHIQFFTPVVKILRN